MTVHFAAHLSQSQPVKARRARGQVANLFGRSAEDSVARRYEADGGVVLHRRWRGRGGEIDMIVQDGDELVFVEVKAARSFGQAMASLRPRQVQRICMAGQEFAGTQPRGLLSPMRFDLAAVDGQGQVQILPNAFGEF